MNPTQQDCDWFEKEVLEALPELTGTARRLTANSADAEDLVADAVAKAWSALPGLRDRSAFRGWICRILTNLYLTQWRSRTARGPHESFDEGQDEEGFSLFDRLHQPFLLWWGNPERQFLDRLLREDLEKAIDQLPDVFRVAVTMADVQGVSYKEIAESTGVPVGTVRSRLARGRSLLQKALWEHACDAGLVPHPLEKEANAR